MKTVVLSLILAAALALPPAQAAPAPRTIEMSVNGLVCAFCAQGIDKKLRKFDATADVFVSLQHKIVAISLREGHDISDEALREALMESGYTLKSVNRTDRTLEAVRDAAGKP